jgi:hypothetical protein
MAEIARLEQAAAVVVRLPGFYDVFVSVPAFTPTAATVRVKQGQLATVSPSLRADPLVTKELGHEISPAKGDTIKVP